MANDHELIADITRLGRMQSEWIREATPYLRAYAHRLWIDGQLNENAEICKLLGEPSAESHELGEDAP